MASPGEPDLIAALFRECRTKPPDEWTGFLQKRCPDTPDIVEKVLNLLKADRSADEAGFLTPREALDPCDADLPRIFGDYELLSVLGRGGMGTVYRARQLKLGREVALKLITRGVSDPAEAARFEREARAAASLQHPGIVKVYQFDKCEGEPFFSMEMIDGPTLQQVIQEDGPLDPERSAGLVSKVALAVEHAHQNGGIIHRDIKPSNILLEPDDAPVLTDFGLVARSDAETARLTETDVPVGTLYYMAPEQIECQAPTSSVDVYGLGCVLHECLCGQPPWYGRSGAAIYHAVKDGEEPEPPELIRSGIPRALRRVRHRAMAKKPEERYASAGELASDLWRYLNGEPVLAAGESFISRSRRIVRRYRRPIAATLIVTVVAVLSVAAWFVGQDRASVRLLSRFEEHLANTDWSVAELQELQALGEGLASYDSEQAAKARDRLVAAADVELQRRIHGASRATGGRSPAARQPT